MASPPKAWFFTLSEGGQHFGFAPFLTYIPPMSKEIYKTLLFNKTLKYVSSSDLVLMKFENS